MTTFLGESNPLLQMKKFKELMHEVTVNPLWMSTKQAHQHRWDPYSNEGGTTAAIAGSNFIVIATDTRMSQSGMNILTRDAEKIHVLNKNIIMANAGFHGDVLCLKRIFNDRLHNYRFNYRRDMTVDVCSELLSRNLYYRRFFPLYTCVLLAGIDENGRGAVFDYDPIGTIERNPYSATGTGEAIVMPFFDAQIGYKTLSSTAIHPEMTLDRAVKIVKDAFRMVSEREIQTGDSINLVVMEAGKELKMTRVSLRED